SSSIIFSSCFSTRPTHQTFESTVSSDHQCETHEVMIIRLCSATVSSLSLIPVDAYCEKLLYSESEIDSMRLSFPLDSVARSMGLAPKVTSMGKMNVSANLVVISLKRLKIDKLKAGVLVGLVWVTRGQLVFLSLSYYKMMGLGWFSVFDSVDERPFGRMYAQKM
ncbi:hypothetical protein HID58_034242, partial [Brassica napus]